MLQTYEGYWNDKGIFPIGSPVKVTGKRRVIITVLDEPVQETPKAAETSQAKAWREFFEGVNASDEEIPEEFERVSFNREVDV